MGVARFAIREKKGTAADRELFARVLGPAEAAVVDWDGAEAEGKRTRGSSA